MSPLFSRSSLWVQPPGVSPFPVTLLPKTPAVSGTPRLVEVDEALDFFGGEKVHGDIYMGVSKNKGTPKWMVYNGKPY